MAATCGADTKSVEKRLSMAKLGGMGGNTHALAALQLPAAAGDDPAAAAASFDAVRTVDIISAAEASMKCGSESYVRTLTFRAVPFPVLPSSMPDMARNKAVCGVGAPTMIAAMLLLLQPLLSALLARELPESAAVTGGLASALEMACATAVVTSSAMPCDNGVLH